MSADIPALLAACRTIAVIGLSAQPDRASHEVAAYLQRHGYRIIPVNPTYAGETILGEHCHPTLTQAQQWLAEQGAGIDLVDIFRKSADVPPVVDEAIAIGARVVWMQLGIVHEDAAATARRAGLAVVMDRCIKIDHMQLR